MNRSVFSAVCLVLLLWAALAPVARAGAAPPFAQLNAACFGVLTDGRLNGSGWFVTSHGLAVTAAHVLKKARKVEILSARDGRLQAKVVALDPGNDLALLLVERLGDFFPTLPFSTAPPEPGDRLSLFGSPLFRHDLMVSGTLASAKAHFEWNELNHCYVTILPVAAMTPDGFSGGPWVNAAGEVVGMQSGMISWRGALMGVAFMVPGEAVAELLATRRDIHPVSLGAILAEPWEGEPKGGGADGSTAGLTVRETVPGGTLARAGLQKGDVLLSVNGVKCEMRDQLLRQVRSYEPGSELTIEMRRVGSGRPETIKAMLQTLERL